MATETHKKKPAKQQALFGLLLLTVIIVFVNILSSTFFTRIDLTSDKRYTLSDSTRQMLRMLNDKVFVKVMLTGSDLPAGFKRLSGSTKELLDELKVYAGSNIQYQFEDPLAGKSDAEKQHIYQEMAEKGLQPTNVQNKAEDEYSEKIIIPGALVYYHGKEIPVNLLVNDNGVNPLEALNNSVSQLENKFGSAIKQLLIERKPKIAFLHGQGELDFYHEYDFVMSMVSFYDYDTLNLSHTVRINKQISAIVIAQPTKAFSEQDKFKLDQYIMHGGKVLWLVSSLNASVDSLANQHPMLALDLPLNLEDQLFTYGVRINPDLLLDLQNNPVPLIVSNNAGSQGPQMRFFPNYYFPVLVPDNNNIINKDVDAVATFFPNTLDTINVKGIKKTILLHSSKYSKIVFSPWQIDIRELKNKPDSSFNRKNLPVAVLLEGSFPSLYKNRVAPAMLQVMADSLKTPFVERSPDNRMVVVADGSIISNDFERNGKPLSLGYYKYTQEFFNNKNFLLNCIDYLTGHPNQIETRTKTVKLRLLDIQRVKKERLKWQLINLFLPVVIIVLFGGVYTILRIRKYSAL